MRIHIQIFALAVVLLVFSSFGMFLWNLAAIESRQLAYSKEMMSQKASEQFVEDIENNFFRIIWYVNSSHLYGNPVYPGIPQNCVESLLDRGLETYVDSLLRVEQAYWGQNYDTLYPGPYRYYAEAYNTKAVNYLLGQGESCLQSHFGPREGLPNKQLKPLASLTRTPIKPAPLS